MNIPAPDEKATSAQDTWGQFFTTAPEQYLYDTPVDQLLDLMPTFADVEEFILDRNEALHEDAAQSGDTDPADRLRAAVEGGNVGAADVLNPDGAWAPVLDLLPAAEVEYLHDAAEQSEDSWDDAL